MSDNTSNMDDAFMRAAFDPNFRFPPIVRPPELELHDIEVTAAKISLTCECGCTGRFKDGVLHCTGTKE